jgi:hypothetical protein
MSAARSQLRWDVGTGEPPKLATTQWVVSGVVGGVLLVAAILQLISFSDFRDNLNDMGLPGPTTWAVCIVLAEILGAAVFFRLRLSYLFRSVSAALAVLVAGFWFVEHLQLISNGQAEQMTSSDFFGRFLPQSPSWWTVIEVTALLLLIVWVLDLSRTAFRPTRRR